MATGLLALPVELLESIHLLSGSSALPCLNKATYSHFNPTSSFSPLYRAKYIIRRLALYSNVHIPTPASSMAIKKTATFLDAAIKIPVCDIQVLHLLEEKCLAALKRHTDGLIRTLGDRRKPGYEKDNGTEKVQQELRKTRDMPLSHHLGKYTRFDITLPKRLLRSLSSDPKASHHDFNTSSLPLLEYILRSLHADPDSSSGYALAKAVLARHFKLIRLLLEYGAQPSIKDNLPVMLAIGRNDMEVVKMLIERDYFPPEEDQEGVAVSTTSAVEAQEGPKKGRKRPSSQTSSPSNRGDGSSPGKRRRLEDRVKVTSGMLEQAVKQGYVPLIDYFMEKGAVPNMRTLAMLSR